MILLTAFYHDSHPARNNELLECLRRNVANELIDEVHLFVEEQCPPGILQTAYPLLADARIRLLPHGRRVTYAGLFSHANTHLSGRRVIIANADIYFDGSLALLAEHELVNRMLCLARWDVQPDGSAALFDRPDSQDAWIFEAPVPEMNCDFHQGLPGCDNRLAWEAHTAGLEISNPSRSVRAYHLHLSRARSYTQQDRVSGPFCLVAPVYLPGDAVDDAPGAVPGPVRDTGPAGASQRTNTKHEPIFALTSLSPSRGNVHYTRRCIASWREAGLKVRAFNHPEEIPILAELYDVEFVPVTQTTMHLFGRHLVPINAMLDWAAGQDAPVLLINADIELRLAEWEMKRARWVAEGGLCYFVRHNHNGDIGTAQREIHGIDAFLFHGRDGAALPASFLSMGQPFWDYWIPYAFAVRGLPVYSVEFPAAFHRDHAINWSWENWRWCTMEFVRITGEPGGDGSYDACRDVSIRVRSMFDRQRIALPQQPPEIREWVRQRFAYAEPKTFLELGSHRGTDTAWMAAIPGVSIHAFEPDPRNHQPPRSNVILNRAAVADRDGTGSLILSGHAWGQEWTHSSSIKQPLNHLHRFPVSFGDAVEIQLVTLDTYCRTQGLEVIDFIWADIQGAEAEMIRGGRETLARTRYLYTEYSDDEMYRGQPALKEILAMLPGFRVLELWEDDVLLVNREMEG